MVDVGAAAKLRVLVVDDSSLVRLYYRSALEKAGFEVEQAINGIEAMERALSQPFDLVIVDVNMPRMDGFTFLRALRRALPDALDLLVVCVEAGLGLDQALQNVTSELAGAHKEICDELTLMLLEMRAGKRRNDALKSLGERTQEPELRRLVTTLTQSDRFGTSLGDALRAHSEFMRVRRRQDAEEKAAKVGVKLVFPIFFFILPSMLVVSIGPGLLQLINGLLPMLKSFQ